eukprot:jgi/Bigna1/59816/fgenesh1_kg.7_\
MAFFNLVRKGKWRTAEVGDVIVPDGFHFDKVLLLRSGVAVAYLENKEVHAYVGQQHNDIPSHERASTTSSSSSSKSSITFHQHLQQHHHQHRVKRGCVIGGTALVDQNVTKDPYKNK